MERGPSGLFEPMLARSWTLLPDARTWTFALRPDVMFHCGEALSANHVAGSIARVLDPSIGGELGTAGVIQSYLTGSQVEILDSLTVRIVTPEPMADLLDLLVDLAITSSSLQGSGPYQVSEVTPDQVDMVAHDRYWRGEPGQRALRWIGLASADARLEALLAGEVDLIADVPVRQTEALHTVPDVELTERMSPTCVAFLINCFEGPGTDVRVRQALNLGLDVPALIELAADGDGQPLTGPLTPLHFGFDPATPAYPHDADAARELLSEAGYSSGLSIAVDVPTTLPDEAVALAEMMRSQWQAIGVDATIRIHEDREGYAHMVREKRIGEAACFDSSPMSSYRVLREKLHSGVAGPWWQGYRNEDVDALLDEAAGTANDPDRQAIYRRAYRQIHDDAPWLFLYRPSYRWASRDPGLWAPSVSGWISVD